MLADMKLQGKKSANHIFRAWGIFILCGLLLLTARAEWINQTNGLRTLLVSLNGWERRGMLGVKPHTLENELLSLKPKPHMMGKQRSGTTLWQRLVSDFSLRTTTAFSWFWEGGELRKWIKRKIASEGGVRKRSYTWGKKEERGKRDKAMDHRFPLVQGKFIETPAQIHVICLAVHWSLGDISLPLQSVQLDKRAAGLSNLQ